MPSPSWILARLEEKGARRGRTLHISSYIWSSVRLRTEATTLTDISSSSQTCGTCPEASGSSESPETSLWECRGSQQMPGSCLMCEVCEVRPSLEVNIFMRSSAYYCPLSSLHPPASLALPVHHRPRDSIPTIQSPAYSITVWRSRGPEVSRTRVQYPSFQLNNERSGLYNYMRTPCLKLIVTRS